MNVSEHQDEYSIDDKGEGYEAGSRSTTPSGRTFYYIEPFAAHRDGANREISELFI